MSEFENALDANGLSRTQRRELADRINDISNFFTYGVELYNILDASNDSRQEIDQLHINLFYQTEFVPSKFEYRASRVATSFEEVTNILENQNLLNPLFESITGYDDEPSDSVAYLINQIRSYYQENEKLSSDKLETIENTVIESIEQVAMAVELPGAELNSPQDISLLFQQMADKLRTSAETYSQEIYELFDFGEYLFDGGSSGWNRNKELAQAVGIVVLAAGIILSIMYAIVTGDAYSLIAMTIVVGSVLLSQ